MEIENIAIRTPLKGDVIWVFRFPYFHCGIYDGDDSVIHFAPQENDNKSKEVAFIFNNSVKLRVNSVRLCGKLLIPHLAGVNLNPAPSVSTLPTAG